MSCPGTGHGYAADIPDWVADGLTRSFTTPSGADPTHQRERRLPRAPADTRVVKPRRAQSWSSCLSTVERNVN